MKVLDDLVVNESALKRSVFLDSLRRVAGHGLEYQGIKIRAPWFMNLPAGFSNLEAITTDMAENNITYPLMIKGEAAASSSFAHTLTIVFNDEGLMNCLEFYVDGFVAQEFVNHNATVYKCYVLGADLSYYSRKSCSNLVVGSDPFVRFHSGKPWPDSLKSTEEPIVKELEQPFLKAAADLLHSATLSTMFGWDILLHAITGDAVIVDFNYFSSFSHLEDLQGLMAANVLRVLEG
jgi:hypothetical protein